MLFREGGSDDVGKIGNDALGEARRYRGRCPPHWGGLCAQSMCVTGYYNRGMVFTLSSEEVELDIFRLS